MEPSNNDSKAMNTLSKLFQQASQLVSEETDKKELSECLEDKSRQEWLKGVYDELVVDVPKKIRAYIDELDSFTLNPSLRDEDRIFEILEDLYDICFDLDAAIDFYKMKGFDKLEAYVDDKNSDIQVLAVNILTVTLQKNTLVQDYFFSANKLEKYHDRLRACAHLRSHITKALISVLSAMATNHVNLAKKLQSLFIQSSLHETVLSYKCSMCFLKMIRLICNLEITQEGLSLPLLSKNFLEKVAESPLNEDLCFALYDLFSHNNDRCKVLLYSSVIKGLKNDREVSRPLRVIFDTMKLMVPAGSKLMITKLDEAYFS